MGQIKDVFAMVAQVGHVQCDSGDRAIEPLVERPLRNLGSERFCAGADQTRVVLLDLGEQ